MRNILVVLLMSLFSLSSFAGDDPPRISGTIAVKHDRFEIDTGECYRLSFLNPIDIVISYSGDLVSDLRAFELRVDGSEASYRIEHKGDGYLSYPSVFGKDYHSERLDIISIDNNGSGLYGLPIYIDDIDALKGAAAGDIRMSAYVNGRAGELIRVEVDLKERSLLFSEAKFHPLRVDRSKDGIVVLLGASDYGRYDYIIKRDSEWKEGSGEGVTEIEFQRQEVDRLGYLAVLVDGYGAGENKVVLKDVSLRGDGSGCVTQK